MFDGVLNMPLISLCFMVDVDECSLGIDKCPDGNICLNSYGGYRCVCPRGFKMTKPDMKCVGKYLNGNSLKKHRCANTLINFLVNARVLLL